MISRDRGLVLRTLKLGETSLIFSVLTPAHGRVRLVAHGARSARSRWAGILQAGNEIDLVFFLRPGRDLGHAREATLVRARLAGLRHLDTIGVGWAVLELLERLLPEGVPEAWILEDAGQAFDALWGCVRRESALLLLCAFELRLLSRMGHAGPLDRCGSCGTSQGPGWLEVHHATRRCARCGRAGMRLGEETLDLLTRLVRAPWDPEVDAEPGSRRQIVVAVHRLCEMHLNGYRVPRGLVFLRQGADPATVPPA